MIDRKRAEAAFYAYTSGYDMDNIMIRLKVDHTLRVAGNCERIAASLGMDSEFVSFAWLLGLLHDIGRFEQVRRYGTFSDAISVDHAEFGANLLFQENLIREFPVENLPESRLRLLETAIRLHNKLALPENLDERTQCFCNLIRDADKADIFRVAAELSLEERIGSNKSMIREAEEASDLVMDCVRQHRCVPRGIRKTGFEIQLSHCCLAFGLVFPESRQISREQGFLDRLLKEYDEDGKPLWNEKERAQLHILRDEIEAAWGEKLREL